MQRGGALTRVDVSKDAYVCMLTHALSEEREETMGLLYGTSACGTHTSSSSCARWR